MEIRYFVHFLLILKHFVIASCIDVQCDPAEIGTNHSISCSSSGVNDSIVWSRVSLQSTTLLWECFKSRTCVPFLPHLSIAYNGKMEYINSSYTSTLVIYNIRQSPGVVFKCSVDKQLEVDVCNPLQFFSKPEGIKCNEILVINEQNMISIVCFLTKVYPAAKMLSNSDPRKTVQCVNDTSSTVGSIKCQSEISVAGMKAGINFIDLQIYPDVTNGEKFGVKKQLNISITFPTPSLGQDCLDISTITKGYIKQGTSANCTCYLKTQGVPPGGVKWFYSNRSDVGSSQSAILQVMFAKKEANQSYNCVGVSVLGKENQGIEFVVKNAYGPEQLSLSSDNHSMYDICSPNKTINIICSVSRLSVAPEPSVNISITNDASLVIIANHSVTHYIYMSSYRPNSVGELNFRCEAHNSVFKELVLTAASTVYIAGPPSQPPALTIGQQRYNDPNGKTLEPQKEGSDLEITCQVYGGFPNTYNMTVSCGDSYNNAATNSDVVRLAIERVGRQLNGKQCVCKAEHASSCYVNNTSSVPLNITFPAEVHQFTANSNSSSLTVSNNSDVIFVCDTESNPPAAVEISKTDLITSRVEKVNFTKQVTCEDSGKYFCKANNTYFKEPNQSSLVLYVQCSLQLIKAMGNYIVFYAQNGKDAVVKFDVLGFPAPVSYSLFKKVQEYDWVITSFSSDSSVNSKYQFEYVPSTLPYGIISVSIFNLTAEDFINYTLSINNSIDVELNISFVLMQENANAETTFDILPAAVGVGIGVFAFIFAVIVLIMIFKGKVLRNLKINNCLRRRQYSDNNVDEATVSTGTSTSQPANNHRYENIDLFQTYDRLHAVDEITSNYNQINLPTVYNSIDISQINPPQQYEQVTIKESTTYQNLE